MKVLSIPSSGKIGDRVAYMSPFGQCFRALVQPRNRRTPPQQHMRGVVGSLAQTWGRTLTEPQRALWSVAGSEVMSHPRCGTSGPLTGEQFFEAINAVLGCVGLPPLWEPPARVVFGLSPVRELTITNDENGARLFVRLAAAPTEDIMVFAQAPCSPARSKRRNVSYLGLLRPAVNGLSEITDLYKAKYGEPRAGTKVFIVTCQEKNGYKGMEVETSQIVPDRPEGRSVATEAAASGASYTAETENSQKPLMYKGCPRGVQGTDAGVEPDLQEGDKAKTQGGDAAKPELGGDGGGSGGSGSPG